MQKLLRLGQLRLGLAALLVVALLGGGAALATATGSPIGVTAPDNDANVADSDDAAEDLAEGADKSITGPDLAAASKAALDHLGEGRVTGSEVGDEESYYEIEVEMDDGRQVDVQLDERFVVVGLN